MIDFILRDKCSYHNELGFKSILNTKSEVDEMHASTVTESKCVLVKCSFQSHFKLFNPQNSKTASPDFP